MTEYSVKKNTIWRWALVLCAAAWIAVGALAQTTQTEVKRGEVVYVSGNQLVVKMEDGQIKIFDVPDSAKFNIDGREMSVHELTPGTKLTQTIETTSTPRTVTTVKTVHGKVWSVTPPYVILTLPDGTNKQYKVPEGTKFNVGGEQKTVFDLRKGMNVTATVTRTATEVEVAQSRQVSGQAPPPPTPPMVGVLLIEEAPAPSAAQAAPPPAAEPAPAAVAQAPAAEPKPTRLPKTGSPAPAFGLIGVLSLSAGLLLRTGRRLWS
jgi:LPXTG-motif cell wall-anchored protein